MMPTQIDITWPRFSILKRLQLTQKEASIVLLKRFQIETRAFIPNVMMFLLRHIIRNAYNSHIYDDGNDDYDHEDL